MKVCFLTGASGVGKTTLVRSLDQKYGNEGEWQFLYFDSIGVPSLDVMVEEYGSPEGWQEAMTHQWIEKIRAKFSDKKFIVLEGQAHPKFVKSAFEKHNIENYELVLVDCSEDEMCYRLTHERHQPDLVNQDMKNWLKHLREASKALGLTILDTTSLSKEQVLQAFEDLLNL